MLVRERETSGAANLPIVASDWLTTDAIVRQQMSKS